MSFLILPSRRVVQPQGPVEVDWGNPLAQGLVFALNPASGERNLATPKQAVTLSPLVLSNSTSGKLVGTGAAEYEVTADLTKNLTLFSVWRSREGSQYLNADAERAVFSARTAGNQGWTWGRPPAIQNAIAGGETGNITRQQFTLNGIAAYVENNYGIESLVDSPVAVRYVRATGVISWFNKGFKSSPDTSASTVGTNGGNLIFRRQGPYASNLQPFIDRTGASYVWNRALSDTEIARVSENPWQLFRPIQRPFFFDMGAGGGTTAVSADNAGEYQLLAAVAADFSGAHEVRESLAADLAGAYQVAVAVESDAAGEYAVLAEVAADLAGEYSIEVAPGTVAADLAGAYAVFAPVQADGPGAYEIAQTVAADVPGAYAVAAEVAADNAGEYAVTQSVLADLDGAYIIAAEVAAELPGTYSIEAQPGTVAADLAGAYSVAAAVSADRTGAYSVLQSVSQDIAGTYAVLQPVAADLAGLYSIAVEDGTVQSDLLGAYGIAAPVLSDRSGSYAVLQPVEASLAGASQVLEAVSSDLAGAASVHAAVAADMEGAYSLAGLVSQDVAGAYAVRQVVAGDLAGAYSFTDSVESDLIGEYAVLAPVWSDLPGSWVIDGFRRLPGRLSKVSAPQRRARIMGSDRNFKA